jgi:O-antigen/teichoic acid export membrane protein
VLLPKEERDAETVFSLAFCILLAICSLLGAGFWFAGDALIGLFPTFQAVRPVMVLLAPMAFALGAVQVLNAWANRQRAYGAMASASVAGQSGNALIAVSLGYLRFPYNGLVLGRLLGQFIGVTILVARLWVVLPRLTVNMPQLRRAAWRYRQFPFFNVPYSLLGVLSQEFLVFALLAYQFGEVAGYFALVRTVLLMPARYLSSSLGLVFFREASQLFGTPKLEEMTFGIMRRLSGPVVPLLVFFMFWSQPLFELAFGDKWGQAGHIAVYYAPVAFLFLYTSWPERLYEVSEKQQVSLAIELGGNLLKFGVVLCLLAKDYGPITAIIGYALADAAYHIAYLLGLFYVGGFDRSRLIHLAGRVIGLAIPCALICALVDRLPLPQLVQAAIAFVLMGGVTAHGTMKSLVGSR